MHKIVSVALLEIMENDVLFEVDKETLEFYNQTFYYAMSFKSIPSKQKIKITPNNCSLIPASCFCSNDENNLVNFSLE